MTGLWFFGGWSKSQWITFGGVGLVVFLVVPLLGKMQSEPGITFKITTVDSRDKI